MLTIAVVTGVPRNEKGKPIVTEAVPSSLVGMKVSGVPGAGVSTTLLARVIV